MQLPDKLTALRKSSGMSQEELAEKLHVSRQAISRWESGTAMPDAANVLQLSRFFHVTTDYLLNGKCHELPNGCDNGPGQRLLPLIALEGAVLVLQIIAAFFLQNDMLTLLCLLPFLAIIVYFEYTCQKKGNGQTQAAARRRLRFYRITLWLGAGFPIRLLVLALFRLYPRPFYTFVADGIAAAVYVAVALILPPLIEKCRPPKA